MADNYVSIRVRADDAAKPELTDLKAKLDELSHKVATARAQVDDKQADAALAALDLRLKRVADKVVNPKITMRGADRALADLLAVDVGMDRLKEKADKLKVEADTEAKKGGILSRMLGGIGSGLSGAGGGLPGIGGLAGSSPYAAGGVFGALIASAPFVGQILAAGIVGGLGTGLAGMGIVGAFGKGKAPDALQMTAAQERLIAAQQKLAALQASGGGKPGQLMSAESAVASAKDTLAKLQNEAIDPAQMKMRQSFSNLTNDVQQSLAEIGKPFQPVLDKVFRTADGVLKALTPIFKAAESMIAGPLGQFADTFLKAFDQPEVKTSILAVGNAFSALVSAVTPQLPNDFRMIANAITAIANNIAANPQAFSGFLNFLVKVVVYALNAINALTVTANFIERNFLPVILGIASAGISSAQQFLGAMHVMADGALSAFGVIVDGAAKAFGWVPGVGGKLQGAAKAFDTFRANVDSTFNKANQTLDGWKHNVDTMQKKVTLSGDITDLQNKLRTAENALKNPELSKVRRAQIQANIAQLKKQLANAQASLNALNGQTATVFIKGVNIGAQVGQVLQQTMPTHASGGIIGAAAGGLRGGLTLVGEHGPELAMLPYGSHVFSNSQSRGMLAGTGGGGRNYSITVNVPPTANMADVGRQVVNAIREFERGSGKSWRS